MIDAVVLCGGLGTRLRPLTYAIPKPLLPVGGRPILEHILDRLASVGYQEIALLTGFRSDMVEERVGSRFRSARLHYRQEPEALGTAGALNLVRGETTRTFLVMNGDVLTDLDLEAMASTHRRGDAAITVAVWPMGVDVAYGVVDSEDSLVTGVREKPQVSLPINAGVYMLSDAVWQHLPEGFFPLTDLVCRCLDAGLTVCAHHFTEYWIDIGAMPQYLQANSDLAEAEERQGRMSV
jgi:NDP-sugar pyrophosphorylase family protein